ncbi:hypothetical protein HH310_24250 [Actinoplanes sp. TBRC 11911]|uniref:hypothetical protein n=1 Tax=Actinoplanes sp. TBRC 11911 TaxID=2729386 RepID=UPI00145D48B0|nr:hypothetical protein [Actinoplanes sp. TBRC 11911]NMO54283.1 hypothetical protein [Actinoplanes sp. TBRC 11911]
MELVRGGDTIVLRDASRVRAILADAAPDSTKEIAALAAAVEESVPPSITGSTGSLSVEGSIDRLARTLADRRALSLGAATWAVRSWAWVLEKGPPPDDAIVDDGDPAAPPMRAGPRQTLREILATYGPGVQRDVSRLRALLADLAPGFRREQAALSAAAEERIPDRIEARSQPDGPLLVAPLADRLVARQALSTDAATWAVASWAWVLGAGPEPADSAADARSQGSAPPPFTQSPPPQPAPAPAAWQADGPVAEEPPTPPPWSAAGAEPPPERPRKRRRRRQVLLVAGILLVLSGGSAAIAAASQDNGYTYTPTYPAPATDSTTTPYDPTPTTPAPTTTTASTWPEFIQNTFYAPSSSCQPVTTNIDGVEYAMMCELTDDRSGSTVSDSVVVRYMGWSSKSEMDAFLDEDKTADSYDESTWSFTTNNSVTQGRLIKFINDGESAIDWSYETKLLTGEAQSTISQSELADWWTSATVE